MERKPKEKPQSNIILILCLIVLFFTLILFLLLKGCNNDIKIEHIDIINLPEQIEIGTFDECNIQLNVIYSDYTTELVDVKEKDIPKEYQHYLYEEGTHSFDYLYKGYEVQFNITMYEVKYTVKFINVVDEVVKEVIVKKNEKVEYPTKEEMYVEGYRFLETYDKDITYATSDVEIKGNYVKTWIVKFYNVLNEVVSTQIVDDKSSAKSPSEEDIKMDGYTFIMWDKVYTNITSNTDIFGIYEEINVTCDHNIVDATCTNPSYCTKCNTTFGNALGHNYIINNKKDATCKTDGYIEYKCSRGCAVTQRETILSTGHNESNWIILEEATCTKEGKKQKKCTSCDEIIREVTISKLNHNYIDGKCNKCDAEDPNYKEEHVHTESDWIIVEESTCTKEGKKQKKCTSCDEVLSEETIKKLEHTIVIDKAVEATCEKMGLTEGSHCSVCKEIIKQQKTVEKLEHNYVDGKCSNCDTKDPNYVVENASKGLTFELNEDKKSYSVTGIGTCTDTDIIIPSVYNGLPVTSIGSYAFSNCIKLTSIEIPNSVTSIGSSVFFCCESLTSIEIPNSVTSIGSYAFSHCDSLTSIEIPNSVTSIGSSVFSNCIKLTSIEIPNSVTSIGSYAFCDCVSLTSIEIPNSVTSIGSYAFSHCESLTSIEIPNSVTNIGDHVFYDCESLTSIEIPNSVTNIGDGAFEWCSNLTSIEIPNSVTSIGDYAFYDCDSLTSIEIPNSVTSIGSYAFSYCESLTSIEISNSVTNIGDYAFSYCESLTSIEIPNSVTIIGSYAFYNCYKLTSIEIPNSVTSIGACAFEACISLTSITIPNSVTIIGLWAFNCCDSLTIYCEAESKPGGWSNEWNSSNRPIVWGYKNE